MAGFAFVPWKGVPGGEVKCRPCHPHHPLQQFASGIQQYAKPEVRVGTEAHECSCHNVVSASICDMSADHSSSEIAYGRVSQSLAD